MTDTTWTGNMAGYYPSDGSGGKKKRARPDKDAAPAGMVAATRFMDNLDGKGPPDFADIRDLTDEQLQALRDNLETLRDDNGRFEKGTPSPNPRGRPRKGRRMYGKAQTVQDVLELFEQPVVVKKNGREETVPAIVAITERMIHLAIGGDWNAIKKCLELREKYSEYREKTLAALMDQALELRNWYSRNAEPMPDHVRKFVDALDQHVAEGQYRAG